MPTKRDAESRSTHGAAVPHRTPSRSGRTRGPGRATVALTAALLAAVAAVPVAPEPAAASAPNYVGDPTHYWNTTLLQVFRELNGPDAAPGRLARAAAMMNAAIFDAETMYHDKWRTRRYEPYLKAGSYFSFIETPDEEERVIGRTAYNVLLDLFGPGTNPNSPDQTSYLDRRFRERFGTEPTADDYLDIQVVNSVVTRMRNFRANDGSTDATVYTLDNEPGAWRPTGAPGSSCSTAGDAVTPRWGEVRPFAISSGSKYRPATPQAFSTYRELLSSPAYAAQVDQVRRLGGAASTAATPSERTVEQTAAAWFWSNDLDGTYKPPGQLLDHTRLVAEQRGVSGKYENARLFALVSLALADASIAGWDVKYRTPIDLWRPESAIRDGGLDRDWQPLSADRNGTRFSPCFPAWASGHATFAGAWAEIMKKYFGTDAVTFTVTTEDPHAPVRSKTFTSFRQAAQENADSRVYLGVHYPWDSTDGLELGRRIAADVYASKLTPIAP
ncbi:phosphoesterase [Planomonospora sphaerica]|uniref:Phosphoesterase n=1 Tax=Planomonospora sphaerica TaxID=161355 RepID=A0A161LJ81_9ACTN|nr:phosphoesterase [Planomonospora sphaerica]